MKNFLSRPREHDELFHPSFVYKKSGRYRYTFVECSSSYYHAECDEIFRKVYLCAVFVKYGMSIMKPEVTDLQSLAN